MIPVHELRNLVIDDVIEDGIPKIHWKTSNGHIVTEKQFLINRLESLSPQLFKDFHPEDQEYAYHEFHAYLSFALSSFKVSTAKPNSYGLSGCPLPLPLQWNLAKNIADLDSPKFFLGTKKYSRWKGYEENIIYGNIYDPYQWNSDTSYKKDVKDNQKHIFQYLKPDGAKYLSLNVGKNVDVISLDEEKQPAIIDNLVQYSEYMTQKTGMLINEQLYFVHDRQIVFGMINAIISSYWSQDIYQAQIIDYLTDIWSKKL